jgi:hypothetical protein
MLCNQFYDYNIANFIHEFVETNLTGDNVFIYKCIYDLNKFDYSEYDGRITDCRQMVNYMLKHYTPEQIFSKMNGKQASEAIKVFKKIEFIDDMMNDYQLTLEDMIMFYYMAYLHVNKKRIIMYLKGFLKF